MAVQPKEWCTMNLQVPAWTCLARVKTGDDHAKTHMQLQVRMSVYSTVWNDTGED